MSNFRLIIQDNSFDSIHDMDIHVSTINDKILSILLLSKGVDIFFDSWSLLSAGLDNYIQFDMILYHIWDPNEIKLPGGVKKVILITVTICVVLY